MLATFLWSAGGLVAAGGGLWIAALFVPTVAVLLKSTLDFLRSPLGTILGVTALGLFLFTSGWLGGDIHGTHTTRVEWAADVAEKKKAAALREAALLAKMKAEADAASMTDQVFTKSIDQKVQTYVAENPVNACRRASHDDISRLLSIR